MNQENLNFLANIWNQVLVNQNYSLCLKRSNNFCELMKRDTEQITEHYLLEGTEGHLIYPTIYKKLLSLSGVDEDSVVNFIICSDLEKDCLACLINENLVEFVLNENDDYHWVQSLIDKQKQKKLSI